MARSSDPVEAARRIVNRLSGLLETWAQWSDAERDGPVDDLVVATISRLAKSSADILPPDYGDDLILLALSGLEPEVPPEDKVAESQLNVRQAQQYVTLMLDALVSEFHLEGETRPPSPLAPPSRRAITAKVSKKRRRQTGRRRTPQ